MVLILLLASLAVSIASGTANNGGSNLRLPIRRQSSTTLDALGDPGYGPPPLRANITQHKYLSPYTAEISVGTPPQLVYPAIDLYSKSLWLNPDCDQAISPDACCANGRYDPNKSSTAGPEDCSNSWEFNSPYGGASGCTVVDDVHFSGADLGSLEIGLANKSWGESAGRLGLGFGCGGKGNISIVDLLKSQGLIATRQFSIAIGSADPSPAGSSDLSLGELVFSGINTGKYAGELRKIDTYAQLEGDPRYFIELTSVGLSDPRNCHLLDTSPPPMPAFLEFTAILSYFPWQYLDNIANFFPDRVFNTTEGVYEVPCFHRAQDASVDFYFHGLVIRVPFRDFILEVDGSCFLGAVQSKTDGEITLGQSFLRAAYTSFDMEDDSIWMAQYENCGDLLLDWDSKRSQMEGLCASKGVTLPASCLTSSTAIPTVGTKSSSSTSCSTTSTHLTSARHSTFSKTSTHHSMSMSHSTERTSRHSSTSDEYSTNTLRYSMTESHSPRSTSRGYTRTSTRSSERNTETSYLTLSRSKSKASSTGSYFTESSADSPVTGSTTTSSTALTTHSSQSPTSGFFATSSLSDTETNSTNTFTFSTLTSLDESAVFTTFPTLTLSFGSESSTRVTPSRSRTARTSALHNSTSWSSLTSVVFSSGLGNITSGGTSTIWSAPTTGISWSNTSFTVTSGTSHWTPIPTLSLSEPNIFESSLTSVTASAGMTRPKHTARPEDGGHARRAVDETTSSSDGTTTVLVTVTLSMIPLPSTVFMPSPIMVPVQTCHCPEMGVSRSVNASASSSYGVKTVTVTERECDARGRTL